MEIVGICPRCNKPGYRFTKGVCFNCYRKFVWNRKKVECKRCKQMRYIQAKGYCSTCYNRLFHMDKILAHQHKKRYNIDYETYKEITKACLICGFDKMVELHHMDRNHENNSNNNLVGLCPNHHRMLHTLQFRQEIKELIKQKRTTEEPTNSKHYSINN